MESDNGFTEWAVARGLKLNGISVHRFPGRGLGIIAERNLKAGDELLIAPNSIIRSLLTVPKSLFKYLGSCSVIGILAADLTRDVSETNAPWRAVMPTKADIEESIPFMWHPSLQALLPPEASSLLEKQKKKISVDWGVISRAFPTMSYDLYLYNWFLVNTRTFYFTSPKIKSKKPLSFDDCAALIPLADMFNHADAGCEVTFSTSGYSICADRQIQKGEEVYISYGNHSNDLLLAEYGFILSENKWDDLSLDTMILPLFSEEQKEELKDAGYLGKYSLNNEAVCYRTQTALKLLCMPTNRWRRFVANGSEDEDKYQLEVDKFLLGAFETFLDTVDEKLNQIELLEFGLGSQKDILTRRWKQIHLLVAAAIARMRSH